MIFKKRIYLSLGVATAILTGCGGSSSPASSPAAGATYGTGYYIDSAVSGVDYICGTEHGTTGSYGEFTFQVGKSCTFKLGDIKLRDVASSKLHNSVKIQEDDIAVARMLQTLDIDGDASNGITINAAVIKAMDDAGITALPDDTTKIAALYEAIKDVPVYKGEQKTKAQTQAHLDETTKELTGAGVAFVLPETWARPDLYNYGDYYEVAYDSLIFSSNNMFTYQTHALVEGAFVAEIDNAGDKYFNLDNGMWVEEAADEDSVSYSLGANKKKVTLPKLNVALTKESVSDISGRSIALDDNVTVMMPSGAKKMLLKVINTADIYSIRGLANTHENAQGNFYTSFTSVLAGQCGTHWFGDVKSDSGLRGVAFTCGQEGQTSGTLVGVKEDYSLLANVGTWEIKNLPNSTISALLMTVKSQYSEENENNRMYAVKDGQVWEGSWGKAGEFDIEAWYNKTAMDAFETKMKTLPTTVETQPVSQLVGMLANRTFYTHKGRANDYMTAMKFNSDVSSVEIEILEGPNTGDVRTQTTSTENNILTIGEGSITFTGMMDEYVSFGEARLYHDRGMATAYYASLNEGASLQDLLAGKTFWEVDDLANNRELNSVVFNSAFTSVVVTEVMGDGSIETIDFTYGDGKMLMGADEYLAFQSQTDNYIEVVDEEGKPKRFYLTRAKAEENLNLN